MGILFFNEKESLKKSKIPLKQFINGKVHFYPLDILTKM